ncbi:MAG: beta-ketoacyl-[acyl-carrier-protein] synthase family protein [Nitrospirae bacterium]|nr:beta-ketoacyl-[acyl-carrier-protein] synthase family protein [Nitrospirota bacterium]
MSIVDGRVAGKIKDFQCQRYLSERQQRRLDPFVHYAVAAASMAIEDSLLDRDQLKGYAIIIGTSRAGITHLSEALKNINSTHRGTITTDAAKRVSSYLMSATTAGMAASYLSQLFGTRGYSLGISNACASGANAVGEAFRLIADGYADVAICGGTEAPLCDVCFMGYEACRAMSRSSLARSSMQGDALSASRPFDLKRDGFVLSEGAAVLVLEEYNRAHRRSARIYAEIAAYANNSDGYDQVRPHSAGQARAMLDAISSAGLSANDVDHVNAHGSSTQLGDISEAAAIKEVFRERLAELPVTANKSSTGHMLAASGAFELAVSAMTIGEGIIPPTINVNEIDPECPINLVSDYVKIPVKTVLSNSFGFGGVNAVMILKKCEDGE